MTEQPSPFGVSEVRPENPVEVIVDEILERGDHADVIQILKNIFDFDVGKDNPDYNPEGTHHERYQFLLSSGLITLNSEDVYQITDMGQNVLNTPRVNQQFHL